MSIKETGRAEASYGQFQIPQPGPHLMMFEEGIQELTNETTQKSSWMLPLSVVDDPIPEENGARGTIFIPLHTNFGVQKLCDVLVCAGLADEFDQLFPNLTLTQNESGYYDLFCTEILDSLMIKLPGRTITIETSVNNRDGKEYCSIDKISAIQKAIPVARPPARPATRPATTVTRPGVAGRPGVTGRKPAPVGRPAPTVPKGTFPDEAIPY
jgi:hypothetical protein